MIAVISDDTTAGREQDAGARLCKSLQAAGRETDYISASSLNVSPCYSCGHCLDKNYGVCILKDDMSEILGRIARAETVVFVTPLTWGSYSSAIKKVFDRMAVLGDVHYYVKKGELVKGMRTRLNSLYGVGIKEACSEKEKNIFKHLVSENTAIMDIKGGSIVLESCDSVDLAVKEILQWKKS